MGARLDTDFSGDGISWSTGLLARPSDALSLGLRGDFPSSASASFTGGAGLRPLAAAGLRGELLEIGLDAAFDEEGVGNPLISLRSEPIEGVSLRAGYSWDENSFTAGFALSLRNMQTGVSGNSPEEQRYFFRTAPRPLTEGTPGFKPRLIRYGFGGRVEELPAMVRAGGWFLGDRSLTMRDHVLRLEMLAGSPYVEGILFVDEHPAASLAEARELLDPLLRFRERGKRVVFYFETASAVDYLLAAASGAEIYLHPAGSIDLKGVAMTRIYLAGLFEDYGIRVENFRSHPYKSGYDIFSEESMRDEEREALEALVADAAASAGELLEMGRGGSLKKEASAVLAEGPYLLAGRALDAGLVDRIMHRSEFETEVPSDDLSMIPGSPLRRDWNDPRPVSIAIIILSGTIHGGEGLPGSSIGAETAVRSIRKAREARSVDAIVLRIDSGGGSLLASDRIAREVARTVSGDNAKPVIVSMGPVAASGAYYIASQADAIFAQPETITGSIGVVAVLPDISRLLEERNIRVESVGSSPDADFGAVYRPLSDREREMFEAKIADGYRMFTAAVAEGRGMELEEVEGLARGRVWSGREAQANGLIDRTGGVREAVEMAIELSGREGPAELADYSVPGFIIRIPFIRMPLPSGRMSVFGAEYIYSFTGSRLKM
jgi:protease-4